MNPSEPNVNEQLKKIETHLQFLEKKLDTLLEQSRNRPQFNRPFRPNHGPGQAHTHGHGNGYSSGNRYEPPRHARPAYGKNFQKKYPPQHRPA